MSVTFEPFRGPGSTPARRRFWDDAMSLAQASRKLPGTNVKVDEYPTGSVISVPDSRAKGGHVPVAVCSHCSLPTIEVVISGLATCPPYTDISLNGTFTLSLFESCGWVGTGGQFDQGFGPQDAFLLVVCPEHVIYSADTGFADQFFLGLGPPGTTLFNNFYATCADGGDGFGGTFST